MGAQFSKTAAKGEASAEKPGEAVAASPSKANGQVKNEKKLKKILNLLLFLSQLRRTLFRILFNSSFDAPVAHSMENTVDPFIFATRGKGIISLFWLNGLGFE